MSESKLMVSKILLYYNSDIFLRTEFYHNIALIQTALQRCMIFQMMKNSLK